MSIQIPARDKTLDLAHWHANHSVGSYAHLKITLDMVKKRIAMLEQRKEEIPPIIYYRERTKLGNNLLKISAELRARKMLLRNVSLFY